MDLAHSLHFYFPVLTATNDDPEEKPATHVSPNVFGNLRFLPWSDEFPQFMDLLVGILCSPTRGRRKIDSSSLIPPPWQIKIPIAARFPQAGGFFLQESEVRNQKSKVKCQMSKVRNRVG